MLGMDFNRLRGVVEATYGLTLGSGRVFFVGSSTDRWFVEEMVSTKVDGTVRTTINSAAASCEDGRGDVIVVLPGEHTLTAELELPSLTRLVGLPGCRENTSISAKAATGLMDLTQEGVVVQGLTFLAINVQDGITLGGASITIRDCGFSSDAGAPSNFISVDGTAGESGEGSRIIDCFFDQTATVAIDLQADGNDQIEDVIIDNCIIGGATTGVAFPAHNVSHVIIRNSTFKASTNPIFCTAGKTGTGSVISGNHFGVATTDACANGTLDASFFFVGNFSRADVSKANPS